MNQGVGIKLLTGRRGCRKVLVVRVRDSKASIDHQTDTQEDHQASTAGRVGQLADRGRHHVLLARFVALSQRVPKEPTEGAKERRTTQEADASHRVHQKRFPSTCIGLTGLEVLDERRLDGIDHLCQKGNQEGNAQEHNTRLANA